MGVFVNVINQVLYFAYDTFDQILRAFGLNWIQLVTGFAVVSVILRLFAANLVGSAVAVHPERKDAAAQQRIEKQKAALSRGRGASFYTAQGKTYNSASAARWNRGRSRGVTFNRSSSGTARDRFIGKM